MPKLRRGGRHPASYFLPGIHYALVSAGDRGKKISLFPPWIPKNPGYVSLLGFPCQSRVRLMSRGWVRRSGRVTFPGDDLGYCVGGVAYLVVREQSTSLLIIASILYAIVSIVDYFLFSMILSIYAYSLMCLSLAKMISVNFLYSFGEK